MVGASLERRVGILEKNMEQLRDLPARMSAVEAQIVQLRADMRGEFSVVREEIWREMQELNAETRTHMLVLHEEVIARIAAIQEGLAPARPARPARRARKTR